MRISGRCAISAWSVLGIEAGGCNCPQIGASGHTGCDQEKGSFFFIGVWKFGRAAARGMMQWQMETPQTLVCTPVIVRYWCILHSSARFCQRSTRLRSAHCHCTVQKTRCAQCQRSAQLVTFGLSSPLASEKSLDNSAWGSGEALKSFPGR